MSLDEAKPWVIISNIRDKPDMEKMKNVPAQVSSLVDDWQSQGKFIWSGTFDNDATSMAIFEATDSEAKNFFEKYDRFCSGVLEYSMYQWDAMPILSLLSDKR